MRYVYLVLTGLIGGVLAGLGMGGGTLTIPLLVLVIGVGQLAAQAVNLVSFLPSGSIALSLHIKNKLVKTSGILFLILPAIAGCILTSRFAINLDAAFIKKMFGAFLTIVAIGSLIAKLIQIRKIGYLH